jgi:hypothetical protein
MNNIISSKINNQNEIIISKINNQNENEIINNQNENENENEIIISKINNQNQNEIIISKINNQNENEIINFRNNNENKIIISKINNQNQNEIIISKINNQNQNEIIISKINNQNENEIINFRNNNENKILFQDIRCNYINWVKFLNIPGCLAIDEYPLYNEYFIRVGDIVLTDGVSTQKLWKLNIICNNEIYKQKQNCIYIITCNRKIITIGGSKNGMKNRIGSYMSGHCIPERTNKNGLPYPGKMSMTNAYVYNTITYYLQHNYTFEVYMYPINSKYIKLNIFNTIKIVPVQLYEEYKQNALKTYFAIKNKYPPLCK